MDQRIRNSLGREFEKICSRVLVEHGYADETDTQNWRNPNPADLVAVNEKTGQKIVAEIKLYISSQIPSDRIYRAIEQLLAHKERFPDARLILILSVPLREELQTLAKTCGIDEVWDLPVLTAKAALSSDLVTRLESLLTRAGVGDNPRAVHQSGIACQPGASRRCWVGLLELRPKTPV